MSIKIETTEGISVISINRPGRKNAVNGATARALYEAFLAYDRDDTAKVAILYGQGGTFCAGADLHELSQISEGGEFNTAKPSQANPLNEDMRQVGPMGPTRLLLSKPVIAAVSGYAVAGGMELALWCDLRVMDKDATMGVFCRRWGVPLIDGGTVRLPRLVGMSRALDWILTGREISADEAWAAGLLARISAPGESLAVAMDLARQLLTFPQGCLRSDRMSVYHQAGLDLESALAGEFAKGMKTIKSGETVGGAQRFAKGAGRHGAFE